MLTANTFRHTNTKKDHIQYSIFAAFSVSIADHLFSPEKFHSMLGLGDMAERHITI